MASTPLYIKADLFAIFLLTGYDRGCVKTRTLRAARAAWPHWRSHVHFRMRFDMLDPA
jgi:hypothetical protein